MSSKIKHVPPKGGRKGGTRFPQLGLAKALEYSSKLVSKTHTGPQPESIILPGVFNTSGTTGQVRASALKQYGLLEGDATAYTATALARQIGGSPPNERSSLLIKALFNAKIFKTLFDTFNGDTVSPAKLRQKAIGEKVHPDVVDKCVNFFIEGIVTAGAGSSSGDGVLIKPTVELGETDTSISAEDTAPGETDAQLDTIETNEEAGKGPKDETPASPEKGNSNQKANELRQPTARRQTQPFTVDLRLDASMDPEKLEKLMQVLKKYGAI